MKRKLLVGIVALAGCVAQAQDATVAYPKNYRHVFQNSAVDVIRVLYPAHGKVGVHDHSDYPTLYIYLSDSGPVRFTHEKPKSFVTTRPPAKVGSFRLAPGMRERHSVENLGTIDSEFLRVELKQIPQGVINQVARGAAPSSLSANEDKVELTNDDLRVERVVCVDAKGCPVKAENAPSLVVALAPQVMQESGTWKQVKLGDVQWLPAAKAETLKPEHAGTAAHVMRIELLH